MDAVVVGAFFQVVFFQVVLLNYVPRAPSRLTFLYAFVPYMSYASSYLTCVCALRSFVSYVPSCVRASSTVLTRLIYPLYVLFSSALRALFLKFTMFLDGFVVQWKLSIFQGLLKPNRATFMCVKKQPWKFLSGKSF